MHRQCSRRWFLVTLASATSVSLLAACGGTAQVGSAGSSATSATSVATGIAAASSAATSTASATAGSAATTGQPATTAAVQAPGTGQITLRLALWQTGVSAQLFNKVYTRYQELNPTIKITQEVTPFAQFFQRLLTGFAGDSAPDCFHSSGSDVIQFAQKNALLDLGPFINRDKVDFSGVWVEEDEMKVKGTWYGMPTWNTDDVLYYNKTAFQNAGIPEPTDDWTWNDMLAAAQKLTTRGANGKVDVWGIQIQNNNQGGWGSMIYANGGDWMNADLSKSTFDQPATLGALQFIYDLMQKYKVMPTTADSDALSKAGISDPFSAGKLAMNTAITSNVPTYTAAAKFDWDIALIPKSPTTGKNASAYIVQPSNISRTTKLAEQCFQLLSWTMGTEAQRILATDKVKFPANIAAAKDANGGFSTPPPVHIARAVQSMDFAKPFHFLANGDDYLKAVEGEIAKAYAGQTTMEVAVKQANAVGDAVLARS
jgi:multiple sugar transport system substrate-binding protein